MFYLIESQFQFEEFERKSYDTVFIEPILFNNNIHPALNNISLLYIKSLIKGEKGYLLCLNHNDSLSLNKEKIEQLLKSYKTIFVRDKKSFLYHFPYSNVYDVSFQEYIEPTILPVFNYYYSKYSNISIINEIIPIVKHYEMCEQIFDKLYNSLINYDFEKHNFWNKKASLVFFYIEKNGIKINNKLFNQKFNVTNGDFFIDNDKVYTQYHLYNFTRRPSNSFNGINFAALDKNNNCRQAIIPENDYLLEIDVSAYHPTLATILSGMKINYNNLYNQLAKECNTTPHDMKKIVFTQLYGGIQERFLHVDYFKYLDEYIKNMWNEFNINGKITCPISNYEYNKSELEDINPNKLFNYILQNYETSNNVNMLWNIIKILLKKNTKIILYTYDSILLDVDKNEENVIEDIKNIFKENNLQIKVKQGMNYDF